MTPLRRNPGNRRNQDANSGGSFFVRRRGTSEPLPCGGVSHRRPNPKFSQKWSRAPPNDQKGPKGCPKGGPGTPKGAQGRPKGPPRVTQDGQRGPKGRPNGAQGTPKGARGKPKSGRREPKEPKVSPLYKQTPDQPPKRPLCYNIK